MGNQKPQLGRPLICLCFAALMEHFFFLGFSGAFFSSRVILGSVSVLFELTQTLRCCNVWRVKLLTYS